MNGLPANQVNALAQTADGFLWVGTGGGLTRFDGAGFTVFGPEHGLPNLPIQELVALPGGGLWVKNQKLDRYWMRNGRFVRDTTGWTQMTAGGDGNIYAYNAREVRALSAQGEVTGEIIPFPGPRMSGTGGLQVTGEGRMWIMLSGKREEEGEMELWTRLGGAWTRMQNGGPFFSPAAFVGQDKAGAIWVGTCGENWRKALRITGADSEMFAIPEPFQKGIYQMVEDGRGTLWAGVHAGGLFRWRGQEAQRQPMSPTEQQPVINVLLPGAGGELWAGTNDEGLFRLTYAPVSSYRVTMSAMGKVTALFPEADGSVLAGTEGTGVYRWRPEGVSRFTADEEFNKYSRYANAFLPLPEGSLWLGMGRGPHEFKNNIRVSDWAFTDQFGATGDSIFCLCADGEGGFWAGTSEGKLYRVHDRAVRQMDLPPQFQQTFLCLERDAEGNVWALGLSGRILKIAPDGRMTVLGEESGVPDVRCGSLFIDSKDRLWLGTAAEGLYRLVGKKFERVITGGPGQLGSVLQIQEDADGWLWLGTLEGICGFDPAGLDREGEGSPPLRWLKAMEGMESEQCTRMRAARDAKGRLYFGTTQGFSSFDPREIKEPLRLPFPLIEGWRLGSGSLSAGPRKIEVPPGDRLGMVFTGLGPELADDMRFRYRLSGLNESWVEAGAGRSVEYAQLPPGEYRFEVQAGRHGQWNPKLAGMPVRVASFFWQTWWFRTLSSLVMISMVMGVMKILERRRMQRVMADIERNRAVNEERTRIARDLHDSLGAGLTQVNMLAQFWEEAVSRSPAALKLRERLRFLVTELDNAVWVTNPAFDRISAVCDYIVSHALSFLGDAGISCELDLSPCFPEDSVSPEIRQHLLHAVKETLTNVVKHAQATRVYFMIRIQSGIIKITIRDNGRGFDPLEAVRKGRNGLGHLQDRLRLIGGRAVQKSSPSGTVIEFAVAYQSS